MGKLTGGPSGAIQGKVAGFNYRYSNGLNIVSQYIKHIRNPKTDAQVQQRFMMKTLAYLFSDLDSKIIRIGYNRKSLCGSGFQNILHELKPFEHGSIMNPNVNSNWWRHIWCWLVDTIRGRDDDRMNMQNFIASTNILNDCLILDMIHDNGCINFAVLYRCDESLKLVLNDKFSFIKNFGDELVMFPQGEGYGMCYWGTFVTDDWDVPIMTWRDHLNISCGGMVIIFSINPNDFNQDQLNDLYNKNFPNNKIFKAFPNNNFINFLNPHDLLDIPVSKISRRFGVDCFKIETPELPGMPKIRWDFDFNKDYCTIEYTKIDNVRKIILTIDRENIKPAFVDGEYITLFIECIDADFQKFVKTADSTPSLSTFEYILDADISEDIFVVNYFRHIPGTCLSRPLSYHVKENTTHRASKLLWAIYNENPYRFSFFRDNFNTCFKILLNTNNVLSFGAGVTVHIIWNGGDDPFDFVTEEKGLVSCNVPRDKESIVITLTLGENTRSISINNKLFKENFNYLGTFILDIVKS
jgi:hypothetical protein